MCAVNWSDVRAEFPALEGWTYLNTATFGLLPRCAEAAIQTHLQGRNEKLCADFLEWFDDLAEIRGLAAQLIHAEPEDIGFVPNASYALSLLMSGMRWSAGDRIVTLVNEFPNNLYFPAMLREQGVEFAEVPGDRLLEAIDARTKLVLLSQMNYSDGYCPDLYSVSKRVHEFSGLLYVDGTQGLGPLQFDVSRVKPDMFVAHGYKWLLSPNGAGILYVSPELRKTLTPHVVGWRSDRRWREVDHLNHGAPEFMDGAEKYEGGMPPFIAIYAMGASLKMFLDIGPAEIEARVGLLAKECGEMLEDLGANIAFPNSPIIAAQFAGVDVSVLARCLKERKILVAARRGNLRVSLHLYNNAEDVANLKLGLSALL